MLAAALLAALPAVIRAVRRSGDDAAVGIEALPIGTNRLRDERIGDFVLGRRA